MYAIFDFRKIKKPIIIIFIIAIMGLAVRFLVLPKFLYPLKYTKIIEKFSNEYSLDEALVYAVIRAESGFDSKAISPKNARGLMQIGEMTGEWGASELNIHDYTKDLLFDPTTNIQIGCWYLSKLMIQYSGEEETAIAAYNAGSGNISRWLQDTEYSSDGKTLYKIPFPETKNYVKRVLRNKKIYKNLYGDKL